MSALEHSLLLFCRQFSVFHWEKIWNCSITFKLSVCIFFDGDLAAAHLLWLSLKFIWQNFFNSLIELTVCPDTDCKDGKKKIWLLIFPMFWRTKNVKFHFQWGKKWSNWKHETGNRLWHPFRTYSVSLQATNDWKICLPRKRMSWNEVKIIPVS